MLTYFLYMPKERYSLAKRFMVDEQHMNEGGKLMAFGAILEGPDPTNLKPIVEQAMPMLIKLMADSSVVVKVSSITHEIYGKVFKNPSPAIPMLCHLIIMYSIRILRTQQLGQ